jgi:hypothetical protein
MPTIINGTSSAITFPDSTVQNTAALTTGGSIASGTITALSTSGITFPSTAVPSADANTLDDYEEGTWTPNDQSGAGLSLSAGNARYTKVGNIVVACAEILYPSTASGASAVIGGLPFTSASASTWGGFQRYTNSSLSLTYAIAPPSTRAEVYSINGTGVSNSGLSSKRVDIVLVYTTD